MTYSTNDFENDALRVARILHLGCRRCEFLLDRWYSGINIQFPVETYPELNNFMSRVSEKVDDYTANGNAKLNTVLAISDLQLPGDI